MDLELEALKERWLLKTEQLMPKAIQEMPIEKIRRAVTWIENGVLVGVPREATPATEEQESSLSEWDGQDDKNSNAYGGM